jgi:hypothetical protein
MEASATRQHTIEALDVLVQIMLNEEAAPGARIAAANALLDRGYGKAPQSIDATLNDKRDATDWTTAELVAYIIERRNARERVLAENSGPREPDSVQ